MDNLKILSENICIPNLNGQFSNYLDCENDSVSIKQSSLSKPMSLTEFKFSVINDAISKIMGEPPYADMGKYAIYMSQLEELYDKNLKIYVGQLLDITAFEDILKQTDEFKKFFPYICYFNENLKKKFKEIPTLGNGNCLFQSLQLGIKEWEQLTPLRVREIICDNLEDVIKRLIKIRNFSTSIIQSTGAPGESNIPIETWIGDELSITVNEITDDIIKQYVEHMQIDGSFGGLIEIITAIYITHVNIIIYQVNGLMNDNFEIIKHELRFDEDISFYTYFNEPSVNLYHCNKTGAGNIEHYELLKEIITAPNEYEYKYMKYKMKYLTLKNNTHYNKYL